MAASPSSNCSLSKPPPERRSPTRLGRSYLSPAGSETGAPFMAGEQLRSFLPLLLLLVCLSTEPAHAAVPTLDYLFPPSLNRGSTNTLTIGGKFDPWPVSVWADCSGITFAATTNTGKFSVETAGNAPLGSHLLRIYNQDGASSPRCFIITREQDELEKEPNDSFKQAQHIEKLPAAVAGRLEKNGDVDSFAVKVEAGKWLVASVDAYSLGSPVDAVLHLLDDQGLRVAFNHDRPQSIDPLLAYKVEKSGTYILQIMGFIHPTGSDVRFSGSAATIYRLTITDGPFVHHVFPAGVQRGRETSLHLLGWNLDQQAPHGIPFNSSNVSPEIEQMLIAITCLEHAPGLNDRIPVVIGDLPEETEVEPNNTSEEAQAISPPCLINGRIATAGDEDRFRFVAQKGQRLEFRIQSASLGYPLDPVLKILDNPKPESSGNEDRDGPDPKLTWTAPANGSYIVAISDRFQHGGEDFVYRLRIAAPKPDFKVSASESAIRLEPGKTNELKLEIARLNGHTNALEITAENLPDGVTTKPPKVPLKGGETKLAFITTPEANRANQPFRILLRDSTSNPPITKRVFFDLKGKESGGDKLINQTDQLWLTVLPKTPPETPKAAEVNK